MNRIRKNEDKWQVLITPSQPFNASFEIMMGGWTDEKLRNYYVKEFSTLQEAQCEALKYPDINWKMMVLNYKSAVHDLKNVIADTIAKEQMLMNLQVNVKTPEEAKNAMFDRVINSGKRFTLVRNMNDILQYHLTNPWTKNCIEIADKLMKEPKLKIIKKVLNAGHILLIGQTDLFVTYEIIISTTLVSQWMDWVNLNPFSSSGIRQEMFNKIINMQRQLDANDLLR